MTKEELLQELTLKVQSGEVTQEELRSALLPVAPVSSVVPEEASPSHHFSVTKILYVFGAAVVVLGITTFVGQIWGDIGSFGRVSVTLGLGLLLTALGSYLVKQQEEQKGLGVVFHFLGGVLIPGGALVTLYEIFGLNMDSPWPVAFAFGIIFGFYLLLNQVHKHDVLTFFAIANGTAFVYLLVAAILDNQYYQYDEIFVYLTMVVGASHLLLAHAFQGTWNKRLIGLLYFAGTLQVLGAAFSQIFDSVLWQMFFFLLVLGGLVLAGFMKSRIILVMSILFFVGYILYITSEYFADSLGWPISLVLLGFVFLGLGYASVTINQRYIKTTA